MTLNLKSERLQQICSSVSLLCFHMVCCLESDLFVFAAFQKQDQNFVPVVWLRSCLCSRSAEVRLHPRSFGQLLSRTSLRLQAAILRGAAAVRALGRQRRDLFVGRNELHGRQPALQRQDSGVRQTLTRQRWDSAPPHQLIALSFLPAAGRLCWTGSVRAQEALISLCWRGFLLSRSQTKVGSASSLTLSFSGLCTTSAFVFTAVVSKRIMKFKYVALWGF